MPSNLRVGSRGSEVSELQRRLTEKGYDTGGVDGIFGRATLNAVVGFQNAQGLSADGIVGPASWRALQGGQSSFEALGTPVLSVGASGAAVTEVQAKLAESGFNPGPTDGDFGSGTRSAVRQFQAAHGLTADGVVGNMTWEALGAGDPNPPISDPHPPAAQGGGARPSLSVGANGAAVVELQQKLEAAGISTGGVDGKFGGATQRAVFQYQRSRGLLVDGVAGGETWKALNAGAAAVAEVKVQLGGSTRDKIVNIARGEVGTVEPRNRNDGETVKYPQFFGRGSEAYCADFVSWVYTHAGVDLNVYNCDTLMNQMKAAGTWKGKADPKPGDIAIFGWGTNQAEHTGLVTGVNADGTVRTVEGNTTLNGRGGVWEQNRNLSQIIGFGTVG